MAVEKFFDHIIENPSWILIGLTTYTAIYLTVTRLLSRPRAGRNPFSTDHRRPKEAIVTDQKARDSVLKQRFKLSKVPENLDVIVIGSGAGGLVTAVLLARAGKRVLVLEQHDQAGGCCHTFEEKGYEFDTGIHYIGDLDNTQSRQLLDQLTAGQLDWASMDDEFDVVILGDPENHQRFGMKSGRQQYFDNLVKFFPDEETAIKRYEELVFAAYKSFGSIVMLKVMPKLLVNLLLKTGLYRFLSCFKYSSTTLQEILDGLTNNQDLKTVLSYICGDYGVLPKDTPFVLHALLIHHYWNGAFYPVGGPSEIVYQMSHIIERLGGRVLVQAPVTNILCDEKGKAIGVRVNRSSGDVDIMAKNIVSDAGVANTFKKLLPANIAQKSCIYPVIDKVGPSFSFVTTFVGVEGSQSDLKLPSSNTWYYPSNDITRTVTEYLSLSLEDLTSVQVPFCYISFPSAKDPTWEQRHPGKSTVLIITLVRWEWFEKWQDERLRHRGEDYEAVKNSIGEKMWQICCQLFPQLDGQKDYMEVGTPVTNKYYLGCPMGEMYGLNQDKARFTAETIATLRADTDIPGLYLTGQDTLLCGFASVLYAGLITASQILHRNLMNDLNKLQKNITGNGEPLKKKM